MRKLSVNRASKLALINCDSIAGREHKVLTDAELAHIKLDLNSIVHTNSKKFGDVVYFNNMDSVKHYQKLLKRIRPELTTEAMREIL